MNDLMVKTRCEVDLMIATPNNFNSGSMMMILDSMLCLIEGMAAERSPGRRPPAPVTSCRQVHVALRRTRHGDGVDVLGVFDDLGEAHIEAGVWTDTLVRTVEYHRTVGKAQTEAGTE